MIKNNYQHKAPFLILDEFGYYQLHDGVTGEKMRLYNATIEVKQDLMNCDYYTMTGVCNVVSTVEEMHDYPAFKIASLMFGGIIGVIYLINTLCEQFPAWHKKPEFRSTYRQDW